MNTRTLYSLHKMITGNVEAALKNYETKYRKAANLEECAILRNECDAYIAKQNLLWEQAMGRA